MPTTATTKNSANLKVVDRNVLNKIGDIFAAEFNAPVQQVLTASLDGNILHGELISDGNYYKYAANDHELGLKFAPGATKEINQYAAGFLASGYGVKTDSIDKPYSYAIGFLRLDAQVKCTKSGTPCGKTCLPKGAVCRKYASNSSRVSIKGIKSSLIPAIDATGKTDAGTPNTTKRRMLGKNMKTVMQQIKQDGEGKDAQGIAAAKQIIKEGDKKEGQPDLIYKGRVKSPVSKKEKERVNLNPDAVSEAGAIGTNVQNAIKVVERNMKKAGTFASSTDKNKSQGKQKMR